jgi:hypothetical protein
VKNWKIISNMATGFGIANIVFAVFSAFVTYSIANLQPGYYPSSFIQLSVLSSMLPYLLLAVLSFVVAGVSMRAAREKIAEEPQTAMQEPQRETETEQIIP